MILQINGEEYRVTSLEFIKFSTSIDVCMCEFMYVDITHISICLCVVYMFYVYVCSVKQNNPQQ